MSSCLDLGCHELLRPCDFLYRWVKDENVRDGDILEADWPTGQWRDGLSCDWSILSGPDQTAKRLGGSLPAYVLRFTIQNCVEIGIRPHHCPVVDKDSPDYNLAHCLLFPTGFRKGCDPKAAGETPRKGEASLCLAGPLAKPLYSASALASQVQCSRSLHREIDPHKHNRLNLCYRDTGVTQANP